MTTVKPPLRPGTRVFHRAQEWAFGSVDGTAVVLAVEAGPFRDGSYEYRVRAGREFSRPPGPGNPEDRETVWSSLACHLPFSELWRSFEELPPEELERLGDLARRAQATPFVHESDLDDAEGVTEGDQA